MKLDRKGSLKYKSGMRKRAIVISLEIATIGTILISSIFLQKKQVSTENVNLSSEYVVNYQVENIITDEIDAKPTYQPTATPIPTPTVSPSPTATPTIVLVVTPVPAPTMVPEEKPIKGMIALTYDDGPCKGITKEILEILKENNCTATFFLIGEYSQNNPDIVSEIYESGNEIGNHSYDHKNFNTLSNDEIADQIERTRQIIYEIIGVSPALFRAPYGNLNNKVIKYIDEYIINWNIDSEDWKTSVSIEDVINVNVIPNLKNGSILLVHTNVPREVEISKIIIPMIKEMGYELGSISEVAEYENVQLEKGKTYYKIKNKH